MKKFLLSVCILSIIFISGCSCTKKKENDNDKNQNIDKDNTEIKITDENVIGEKTVDGITFENTTFTVESGVTKIVTKITNNTGSDFYLENYQLIVTDENGNLLTKMTSTVEENFAPGESKSKTTPTSVDLTDAKNVKYIVNLKLS